MKVEPWSVIISIIMLSIFLIPIIYDQMVKNKHKLRSQLKEMTLGKGVDLNKYDVWDDTHALGVDSDRTYVFYTSLSGKENVGIKLSKLKKCTLSETDNPAGDTHQLDLVLELKSSGTLHKFPFKLDSKRTANTALAEEWQSTINKYIT